MLKIVKHCQQARPANVTGQLLGLDIDGTLEVTNTFAFPKSDEGNDEALAEYQMQMMQCLRDVNVDNNTVGWYQSCYFSQFITEECVETQFNYQVRRAAPNQVASIHDMTCSRSYAHVSPPWYSPRLPQSNIKSAVVLIYDPSRARSSGVALRAFRLTDTFMALYADGKVTYDALASANRSAGANDVFEEVKISVRNSHLNSALLLELSDECGLATNAADFSRLELNTNPFLEKQLQVRSPASVREAAWRRFATRTLLHPPPPAPAPAPNLSRPLSRPLHAVPPVASAAPYRRCGGPPAGEWEASVLRARGAAPEGCPGGAPGEAAQ